MLSTLELFTLGGVAYSFGMILPMVFFTRDIM